MPLTTLLPAPKGMTIADVDLMNHYVRERDSLNPGWQWSEVSSAPDIAPPGFVRLVGAVCPSDKYGWAVWGKRERGTERTVFIETSKFEAWKRGKAAELGVCGTCFGGGVRLVSVNFKSGTEYRPCPACGGTGSATTNQLTAAGDATKGV